ncbi:MAG: hypothetical protein MUO27_04675 [Sedimentisphaerales bacterium]|nr:hypothetical protein [Sedimentisphaerales bacterium]
MVKREASMESLSSNLHNFLNRTARIYYSSPDKKFLRGAMVGSLRTGRPVVCQMVRCLPNQCTKFVSRIDCFGLSPLRCGKILFSHPLEVRILPLAVKVLFSPLVCPRLPSEIW